MDLRSFLTSTLEIEWKDDSVLTLPATTMKQYYKMLDIDEVGTDQLKKQAGMRDAFLLEALNRNLDGIEISKKDIEELPVIYLNAIYNKILYNALGLISDPN